MVGHRAKGPIPRILTLTMPRETRGRSTMPMRARDLRGRARGIISIIIAVIILPSHMSRPGGAIRIPTMDPMGQDLKKTFKIGLGRRPSKLTRISRARRGGHRSLMRGVTESIIKAGLELRVRGERVIGDREQIMS